MWVREMGGARSCRVIWVMERAFTFILIGAGRHCRILSKEMTCDLFKRVPLTLC